MASKSKSKSKSKDEDKKKSKSKSKDKPSSKSSKKDKPSSKSKSSSKSKTKARAKKSVEELKPIKKSYNMTELVEKIGSKVQEVKGFDAEDDTLAKKVVKATLESLMKLMRGSIHPKGSRTFVLPGFFKIVSSDKKVAAIKKGTMVKKGFGSDEMVKHKGRPASVKQVLKIRPLSKLRTAAKGE